MDKQSEKKKPNLLARFTRQYSSSITGVALSAMSAWMIVTGLKGLAGFTVNQQTALADLLGIVIIVGIARWIKVKYNIK